MKKNVFLFSSAFLCLFVNAQEQKEIKKGMQAAIADKFPFTRVLDVQYMQYLPSDFDSELFGEDFQEGTIQEHSRLRVSANLPVIMKPKWNITTSLIYMYDNYNFKDVHNTGRYNNAPLPNGKHDFHYLSGSLSFTYFSKLFNKPFLYNASIFTDGTEQSAERLKGFIGTTLVIKRTAQTTITTGLLVFIDPASPVPVTPIFTLEHKFKDSKWVFDCILPQRILFKRDVFKNSRISLGSELAPSGFYVYLSQPGFADVYDYRQLEVRTGLTFETLLAKDLIAYGKAGWANTFNSRVTERGELTSNYILSTTQDGTGYLSFGMSFNPFAKKSKI